MKKVKNALLTILGLALVAVLSVAGTLAYLQDDDSDVNVMTMGNVKIAQHEYERVQNEDGTYPTKEIDGKTSYELKEFTQDKPLYPIVGDPSKPGNDPEYKGWDTTATVRMSQVDSYGGMEVFAGKNAQDKFVTVENTGRNDAYVRTLVAIEIGEGNPALIGTSYHQTWSENEIGTIEVNGNKYFLIEYLYNGASGVRHENGVLPAKDTTYPSLSQVYLKSETTNEDCENLDGNGNGKLDILVLSQAVQVSGFDKAQEALDIAFGETNATNAAKWFTSMKKVVNKISGEYIIRQNTIINLEEETTTDFIDNLGFNVTINGNENVLTSGSAADYGIISNTAGNTVINDITIHSLGGGIASVNGSKVEVNNVNLDVNSTSTSARYLFYTEGTGSEIVINSGNFDFNKTQNQKRAYIYAGEGTTVYVKGGTFGKASTRSGYTAGILGDGKVIITGGTFGFNPTKWVASGYKAVKDGSTWTVVAE